MNREEFFAEIRKTANENNEPYLIELLKLRGFLLYTDDGKIYLSDNSHTGDEFFLNSLLEKYDFGCLANSQVLLKDNTDYSVFEAEFSYGDNSIGFETSYYIYKWDYFKLRTHGFKVEVKILEPFIAAYVKAISSIGILTAMSCDGNHSGREKLYISFCDTGSQIFHRLIWQCCLSEIINLDWNASYEEVHFSDSTQYDVYYKLNRAAQYIYDNRIELRRIKQNALASFSNSYLTRTPNEEIAQEFEKNVRAEFEEPHFI